MNGFMDLEGLEELAMHAAVRVDVYNWHHENNKQLFNGNTLYFASLEFEKGMASPNMRKEILRGYGLAVDGIYRRKPWERALDMVRWKGPTELELIPLMTWDERVKAEYIAFNRENMIASSPRGDDWARVFMEAEMRIETQVALHNVYLMKNYRILGSYFPGTHFLESVQALIWRKLGLEPYGPYGRSMIPVYQRDFETRHGMS